MKYKLQQKDNPQNREAIAKWYASPAATDKMSPDELNREISSACTLTPADTEGVFAATALIMPRHLSKNGTVYLRGIGTFRIGLKSAGVDNPNDFTPSHILGHHIIFTPDQSLLKALQNMPYEKIDQIGAKKIEINCVLDQLSGTMNRQLTRGGWVHVSGSMLLIGGTHESVGLKLVSVDSPVTINLPMDVISLNQLGKIIFLLPSDLPVGRYRLRIVTQIAKDAKRFLKNTRAYTYEPILLIK